MPTESELKRITLQAARNVRRVYRAADTSGEVLERWLDRQINRTTRITRTQAAAIIPRWEDYRDKVISLESAVADFLNIAID